MSRQRSASWLQGFARAMPEDPRYWRRLDRELRIISDKTLEGYFERVIEILALTEDIPHMARGSAASSLLCYLIGVSNFDPIAEGIRVERFLHERRDDCPDVDLDFPWDRHREVHERVLMRWPGQAARVSNRVHFRIKGARREALRQLGYKPADLGLMSAAQLNRVEEVAEALLGEHSHFSKHVGGVVVLPEAIPQEAMLTPTQLRLDKDEVEARGWWKIDLLSSRGLGQLMAIDGRALEDYPERDEATADLLCRGDVLGVTQAESPAFRKLVRAVQPRSRREVAMVLALLRPAAASRGRKARFLKRWRAGREATTLVFEDDATDLIASVLRCDHAEADVYRRAFSRGDTPLVADFARRIRGNPRLAEIMDDLSQMRSYSFCKAHALEMAHLVWALAWQKCHAPRRFWWAALNHCASMYRGWVHIEEARRAGWRIVGELAPWRMDGDALVGSRCQLALFEPGAVEQYVRRGWWREGGFLPGFGLRADEAGIAFTGLVATGRPYRSEDGHAVTFVTVGVGGRYVDLAIEGRVSMRGVDAIEGRGQLRASYGSPFVQVEALRLLRLGAEGFEEIPFDHAEIGAALERDREGKARDLPDPVD